jgi:glutathione S-transferase
VIVALPLVFYALDLSTYCAKVAIVLAAKNIPHECREPPGGYRSDEYRAIVPLGRIPAIVEGDFVLSESEVINEYLEERFPAPALLPREPQARARVRLLARFHDLYLEPHLRAVFAHLDPARRDAAHVAAKAADFEAGLARLAALATPQPYLAGPAFSLADCAFPATLGLAALVFGALGHPLRIPDPQGAWQATVLAHPAVAPVLARAHTAAQRWIEAKLGGTR